MLRTQQRPNKTAHHAAEQAVASAAAIATAATHRFVIAVIDGGDPQSTAGHLKNQLCARAFHSVI
jgi:hypothetical protein